MLRLGSNLPSLAVSSSDNVKCRSMMHPAYSTYAHSLSSATEQFDQSGNQTQLYYDTRNWILVVDPNHAHRVYKEML